MVKNPPANSGEIRDMGLIPGSGRSLGGRHGNPLQHSCLANPHGQRNLAGYSPRGNRARHDWATKHTHVPYTIQYIFVIDSFCNWKFILLNPIELFHPTSCATPFWHPTIPPCVWIYFWVHLSFQMRLSFSSLKYWEMELLTHMTVLFLIIWGMSIHVSVVTVQIYIFTTVYEGSLFSIPLPMSVLFVFFLMIAILAGVRYVIVVLIVSPWLLGMLSTFLCVCWPSVCLTWRNVFFSRSSSHF